MVGRGGENQNSDSIPAQINVCSNPASRGRQGLADLKGQGEESRGKGGERRIWRQNGVKDMGAQGRGAQAGKVWQSACGREEVRREEKEKIRDPQDGKKPRDAGRQ